MPAESELLLWPGRHFREPYISAQKETRLFFLPYAKTPYAPPTYSAPSNKCASKERKRRGKEKKNERRKKAGRCFYYIAIYSFFFFFFFVPFFFFVSFEIYARLIQRVFTVRDEAQEIKKRMLCHISAIDRGSWLSFASYRRLGLARGKSATTTKTPTEANGTRRRYSYFSSPLRFFHLAARSSLFLFV